jgi:hypothetical protein
MSVISFLNLSVSTTSGTAITATTNNNMTTPTIQPNIFKTLRTALSPPHQPAGHYKADYASLT